MTGAFPGFSLGVLVMGQGPVEARGKRAVFSKARWARLCVRGAGSFHRACPFVTSGPRGALLHLPRVQLVKSRCPYDLRCTCVIFQPERWGPNSQTLAPLRVRAHRGDHALRHQHRASSTQGQAGKMTHMNFRRARITSDSLASIADFGHHLIKIGFSERLLSPTTVIVHGAVEETSATPPVREHSIFTLVKEGNEWLIAAVQSAQPEQWAPLAAGATAEGCL